ncbi:unnamed protein product [Oncorhynchus mykiss]|uniref:Uncharacterized protein n=1 Tax=Oncorhynchus mykiss TaxID=8022 RepID=A0A060WVQ6_ONCMY|nr:unnamed protein product [Oncorhynchus mykiss]
MLVIAYQHARIPACHCDLFISEPNIRINVVIHIQSLSVFEQICNGGLGDTCEGNCVYFHRSQISHSSYTLDCTHTHTLLPQPHVTFSSWRTKWPVLPGVELSPDCLCGHNASQCIELQLRCQSNPWRHRSGSLGTVTPRRNWRGCRPSRGELDEMKARSLDDVSEMVKELNSTIVEKKSALAPAMKEPRPLRQQRQVNVTRCETLSVVSSSDCVITQSCVYRISQMYNPRLLCETRRLAKHDRRSIVSPTKS